ncbi:MAG TPA: lysylphosphatidylglycerol synthase transmembrane domain-containing protein [Trueperaceae bacterium]|nr:lysylphosphatidylglycerol synthase transmembrane domain-containing protein [Trueperaceae bacterium]
MSRLKWLLVILPLGLLALYISLFTSPGKLWQALSHAQPLWVAAAFATHLVFFILYGALYEYGFKAVGVSANTWRLIPVYFASIYLNTVAPSGGTSGASVFVADARSRGEPPARAAIGTVIVLIADLATLLPFIAATVWVLNGRTDLQTFEILGIAAYVAFIGGLIGAVVVARRREAAVRSGLEWFSRQVARAWGWFHRDPPLSDDWAEIQSRDMCFAARAIVNHPLTVTRLAALGVATHVANLAGLYLLFVAFGQPLTFGPAIAGFTLGIVFFVVAVVPQGVAAVEGVMGLVFTSLGMHPATAFGIIIAFRGMNYWLPLLLGVFFLHRLTRVVRQGRERPHGNETAARTAQTEGGG